MAKVSVLVDTDVFIDYLNTGRFSSVFDSSHFSVYYPIVAKKELLPPRLDSGYKLSRPSIIQNLWLSRLDKA